MSVREVVTYIDDAPFSWRVSGEFANGESAQPLYDAATDKLHPILGEEGYTVRPLPAGMADAARAAIGDFLAAWGIAPELENYHAQVDDARHGEIISRTREMKMKDLRIDGDALCAALGEQLGVTLATHIPDIGGDFVIVRINRPRSTDFNPPHRDGALSIWRNTLNLWIPIAGCTPQTSLPVVAGSHLWRECDCLQTKARGATINGNVYNVPALIQHRGEDIAMRRGAARFGEALIFTPYLLHGAAVNQSDHSRVSLELRLLVDGQNYAAQ